MFGSTQWQSSHHMRFSPDAVSVVRPKPNRLLRRSGMLHVSESSRRRTLSRFSVASCVAHQLATESDLNVDVPSGFKNCKNSSDTPWRTRYGRSPFEKNPPRSIVSIPYSWKLPKRSVLPNEPLNVGSGGPK